MRRSDSRSRDDCNKHWRLPKKNSCSRFETSHPKNRELNLGWQNQSIVRNNLDKLLFNIEPKHLKDDGTEVLVENGKELGLAQKRSATALADWRTGEIYAVGTPETLRTEANSWANAIELEVLIVLPEPKCGLANPDYSIPLYDFVTLPDPERGHRLPLNTCLAPQALENIETTQSYLNDPDIVG